MASASSRFQPRVLLFQHPQPFGLGDVHAPILRFPFVYAAIADAVLEDIAATQSLEADAQSKKDRLAAICADAASDPRKQEERIGPAINVGAIRRGEAIAWALRESVSVKHRTSACRPKSLPRRRGEPPRISRDLLVR
jgi:hypothetical protein